MAEKAPSVTSSTPSHSWRGWLWDSADVSKEERKFLFKLDATLLTFGTLGMLIKWIDTSNITNAFVSGMKEDLGLYGNQYNYIIVSWTIGYIVGQLPSNFILTRVPAHIWIPFQEIGWTVFTFALAGAKSYRALLGLRFVVGLFEAGYWPALYYVLGSWYNKRMSLQHVRVCSVNVTNIFHQAS
jgi:ACS family pantothenate transporter-like MFS transporter